MHAMRLITKINRYFKFQVSASQSIEQKSLNLIVEIHH